MFEIRFEPVQCNFALICNTLTTAPNSTQKLPNLDALRGLAALGVFCFHRFGIYLDITGVENKSWFQAFQTVMSKGFQGVSFFFTLSGFLITWLALKEINRSKTFNSGHFFIRRVLRIWPVYLVTVLFLFIVFPMISSAEIPYSLWQFGLFLANFNEISAGADSNLNMFTVLWSVSVEEQFYVCFAGLMLLPVLKNTKNLVYAFLLIVISSMIFRFLQFPDHRVNYYHTLAVMSDIAMGGLLAILYFKNSTFIQRIANLQISTSAFIYALGFGWVLSQHSILPMELYPLDRLITSLFWCFVITHQITTAHKMFHASRIPGLSALGTVSYGFYMWHVLIMWVFGVTVMENTLLSLAEMLGITLLMGLATWALCYISYRLMEKPLMGLGRAFRT